MDCLNCTKVDCDNNRLTDADRKQQDLFDREVIKERDKEERHALRKGDLKFYDYNHSDKGKARAKRYEQSEKGKANQRRKTQKKIASGKNAEACRRYYQRKKERIEHEKNKLDSEKKRTD